MLKRKGLRSGYTTGACAAAAAKAATMLLLSAEERKRRRAEGKEVEIPFPDGSRVKFRIQDSGFSIQDKTAFASIIKNAGDDPDVTNGAEITAEARFVEQQRNRAAEQQDKDKDTSVLLRFCASALTIKGGKGVGIATKPGLPVPVGEPAINPVPRRMIQETVMEAISNFKFQGDCPGFTGAAVESGLSPTSAIEITISVTDGERLAKKTLNSRLGIIGGISILGTTGIVKPLSSEAWTATITSSMDVAKAMGRDEVVISAGRSSEKAHMHKFNFPEEAYIMMGDYLEFALIEAKKHGFKKIHLCAQWAKMLKIAMATPQTHVRHGALDTRRAVEFLNTIVIAIPLDAQFNTAREIFDLALSLQPSAFSKVCEAAKRYAEKITGSVPVIAYLVSYEGEIITGSR